VCIQNSLNVYVWIYIYHSLRCMFSFQLLTVVRRCLIRDLKYTNTYFENHVFAFRWKKQWKESLMKCSFFLFSIGLGSSRLHGHSHGWTRTPKVTYIMSQQDRTFFCLVGVSFTNVFRAMEKSHLQNLSFVIQNLNNSSVCELFIVAWVHGLHRKVRSIPERSL